MFCLDLARSGLGWQVAFAELSMKQFEGEVITDSRQSRVVTISFVPHEGMGSIEFVPRKIDFSGTDRFVNQLSAFCGNVGILSSPDHQHLPLNFLETIEGVVLH